MRKTAYLKFLDELVLPFVIIGAARYFGVFVATYLRPIQFDFNSHSDLISAPFLNFNYPAHLLFANSISWLFVAVTLAVFFGFVIFRNSYFHQDWVHPSAAARLHNKKMEFLIIEAREAFYQAISWFFLTAVLLILVTGEFLAGNLSILAFGAVWGVALSLILLFILGIIRDRELSRKKV